MSSDPSAKTRTKPLSKQEATEQLELEIDTLLNSIDDDLTKITETLTSSLDPEEASAQADAATQLALEDAAANPTATTSPETNLESTSDSTPEPDQVANESESNTDESTDEADPILEGQIDPEPVNEANLANDPGLGTEHAPEENPAEDLPVDEAASAVVETIAPPDPTPVVEEEEPAVDLDVTELAEPPESPADAEVENPPEVDTEAGAEVSAQEASAESPEIVAAPPASDAEVAIDSTDSPTLDEAVHKVEDPVIPNEIDTTEPGVPLSETPFGQFAGDGADASPAADLEELDRMLAESADSTTATSFSDSSAPTSTPTETETSAEPQTTPEPTPAPTSEPLESPASDDTPATRPTAQAETASEAEAHISPPESMGAQDTSVEAKEEVAEAAQADTSKLADELARFIQSIKTAIWDRIPPPVQKGLQATHSIYQAIPYKEKPIQWSHTLLARVNRPWRDLSAESQLGALTVAAASAALGIVALAIVWMRGG